MVVLLQIIWMWLVSEKQDERYVVLVDMYDKSEQETISKERYKQIFDEYIRLN